MNDEHPKPFAELMKDWSPEGTDRMTTRKHLEALNRKREELCFEHDRTTPKGRPNMRLLYSTPEAFEPPAKVMWLGKNPGGHPVDGDRHPHDTPFTQQRGWSSYLDDEWGGFGKGEHPMQRAVLSAATLFAGDSDEGDAFLRASPAGNLSPFRSASWHDLPIPLRNIEVGQYLIRLAQPRVLVLLFSERSLWCQLMAALDRKMPTNEIQVSASLGYVLRESVGRVSPKYVFGLPSVNTSTVGQNEKVLKVLRERLTAHSLLGGAASAELQI